MFEIQAFSTALAVDWNQFATAVLSQVKAGTRPLAYRNYAKTWPERRIS